MSQAKNGRRPFLAWVTFLANLYLLIFSVDAIISVGDEIIQGLTGSMALSSARTIAALTAVIASFVMILLLALAPQLPKRIFVPLCLFAFWGALGAPPVGFGNDGSWAGLFLVLGQLSLAGLAFVLIQHQTGEKWLSAERLPTKSHVGLRVAVSLLAVFIALLALPVLFLGSMVAVAERETAGYVRLTGTGVEVADRTFRKGDQTIRLIGMVHIGEARFYNDLFKGFPENALVLAEGATDKNKVLAGNLSYKRVAKLLGLDQQPALRPNINGENRTPDSTPETVPDSRSGTDASADTPVREAVPVAPDVVYADIDLAELSDTTINFLNDTAELYDSPSIGVAWQRYLDLNTKYPQSAIDIVFGDLIDRRNARLLQEFDRWDNDYTFIVIPWGAMHMPGIEKGMISRGYKFESERYLPLIRYDTLLERLSAR